ncbi:hypothetical protein JHK82_050498 [Glycine max]|uniref:Hydroxyproline-rich glycoprotein family protein n=2 Tax=Glycine soja TaxID=3848 RepID=A0A445FTB2_GLYSO|nr:hypothetical protein JHK87_050194 [Glycine soja]KAG4936222.1 hypothetical protein JHK85_051141 [Glycine max]KAG5091720.1 hypothetical protein JHK82_050498 [Glycine max]KAH1198228.1 Uncharacterized protein GmHk_18G051841 [Glycine max]RZB52147.1 hypothetical protein D0Y65_048542 [Glycine soja]
MPPIFASNAQTTTLTFIHFSSKSSSHILFVVSSHECRNGIIVMESQDLSSPPHVDASRPSLGFPLGTALLLIIIFTLSGVLSCCYHWDRVCSLRQSFSDSEPQMPSSPTKSKHSKELKQNRGQSLPVLMPGDDVPKFIAMPCPCQPSRPDSIVVTVEMEKPPPKPPQLPVPFYL